MLNPFKKDRGNPERCVLCRKFLKPNQLDMGYCYTCAVLEIAAIKKSIALRFLAAAFLIALVFFVSRYASANGYQGEHGNMVIPLVTGTLTINGHAFRQMFEPTPAAEALRTFALFFGPFGGRIRKKDEKYNSHIAAAQLNAATVERSFAMGSAYSQESAGMLFIEIALSVISGPFFFVYRPLRMRRLKAYAEDNRD